MTICNMSIEGGARVGYVNPDETTFEYLRGRRFAPEGDAFDRAVRVVAAAWRPIRTRRTTTASTIDAADDRADRDVGHQSRASRSPSTARLPDPRRGRASDRAGARAKRSSSWASAPASRWPARRSTSRSSARARTARLSDLREAAQDRARATTSRRTCARWSCRDRRPCASAAEREGLDDVFREAGFEWRGAGCSMCLAMNPDRLDGREVCASSSNRNFKGRQGSPTGPHAADEPGDGRGRRGRRRSRGRAVVARRRRASRVQ